MDEDGKVTLDFVFDTAKKTELQCMIADARVGYGNARKKGENKLALYYADSLAAYVDVLGVASPLEPQGNESDKP